MFCEAEPSREGKEMGKKNIAKYTIPLNISILSKRVEKSQEGGKKKEDGSRAMKRPN